MVELELEVVLLLNSCSAATHEISVCISFVFEVDGVTESAYDVEWSASVCYVVKIFVECR